MKKISVFTLVLLCSSVFALAGTPKMGLGARIAAGYGTIWGLEDDWSGGENDETPSGIDLDVGIIGRYELTPIFHFTPELLFRYASLSQDDDLGERKFSQTDIQIPLLVRANVTPKMYGYVGPQMGLNIGSDVSISANVTNKATGEASKKSFSDDIDQAVFNFGVSAGFGYYALEKLSIDLRIYLGLTELYPDAKSVMVDLNGAKLFAIKVGFNYWIF